MNRIKKIAMIMLAFTFMMVLAACGNEGASSTTNAQPSEPVQSSNQETDEGSAADVQTSVASEDENKSEGNTEPEQQSSANDILVVYFSRTGEQYGVGVINEGNTAIVAKMIAENTGADTFEILPTDDHYPMTYDELTDVAKREQNENARPSYAGEVPDLSQYSTIFIGAPVWWGDWPMICYTFFENEDLSGKTLYPFSTHAGSGLSGFDRKLSSAVPDATVGEGLAISGTECQNNKESVRDKVSEWLSGLEY